MSGVEWSGKGKNHFDTVLSERLRLEHGTRWRFVPEDWLRRREPPRPLWPRQCMSNRCSQPQFTKLAVTQQGLSWALTRGLVRGAVQSSTLLLMAAA